MDFPKRAPEHIAETDSWKILIERSPSDWIIREVSERDYGIDAYIEIPRGNGDLAGDLMSIQVKGMSSVKWSKRDNSEFARFSGIAKSTVNYWMGLPVPVLLVVCDLKTRRAYFAPVKLQIRNRYDEYLSQSTFGFDLLSHAEIGSIEGHVLFLIEYLRERNADRFQEAVLSIQSHLEMYLEFIERNKNLDAHLGLEDDEEVLFVQIYKTVTFLEDWLGIKSILPELEYIYREDRKAFNSEWYQLHHWSLHSTIPMLKGALFEVMVRVKALVTERQREYWAETQPLLYRVTENLDLDLLRNRDGW